ncbi:MBOAT family protein [Candidatus Sumerlaeota bacterium]|nr:MBOAT family protein [Candidatus Sumerlaeota bacterium]
MASALIDYICGLVISGAFGNNLPIKKLEKGAKRTTLQKAALITSIITNLSILGFFKYANFGIRNYNLFVGMLGLESLRLETAVNFILPLGISFYTFQSMSYTFDVYLGNTRATRNFLNYATYIIMFPQLVAGPIIRYRDVAKQLVERTITREGFAYGIRRFVVGLGKKVLIANTLAVPVNQIFDVPFSQMTPGLAWLGLFGFSLQIYYDFSGYSDMAIGLGRMLGFKFKENFRYPFIAASATEYFQRWHISLNTWLRDYPYRAMGGSRGSAFKVYFNIITLLVLVGLWHGASWNFIFWGLLCGFYLSVQRYMIRNNLKTRVWHPIKVIFCFFLFMTSMAFFRAESLTQAFVFLKGIFGFVDGDGVEYHTGLYLNNKIILCLIVGYIGSLPVVPWLVSYYEKIRSRCSSRIMPLVEGLFLAGRVTCIILIFLGSAMTLASETYTPFIYFRF